jgi:hypothetical protein
MRIASDCLMRLFRAGALLCLMLFPEAAWSQSPVAVPNRVAQHTVFIVLIVGAFLAWAASFSYSTMRARTGPDERAALGARREALLDELAGAEEQRDAGAISPEQFERRRRALRGQLASLIQKQTAGPAERKHGGTEPSRKAGRRP